MKPASICIHVVLFCALVVTTRAAVTLFEQAGFPTRSDLVEQGHNHYLRHEYNEAALAFEEAAEANDSNAFYALGKLYRLGKGVPKNLTKAAACYQKALQLQHPFAQKELALLYLEQSPESENFSQGVKLLHQAAKDGSSEAMLHYGKLLIDGYGVSQNVTEGWSWIVRSASSGSDFFAGEACFLLALRAQRKNDTAAAIDLFKKAARKGHANAMMKLADYHLQENEILDPKQGIQWLKTAAAKGSALAALKLGFWHEYGSPGEPKEPDYPQAFASYQRAANGGMTLGWHKVGAYYDKGKGMAANTALAAEAYRKAAEDGHSISAFNLSIMYQHGRGVEKNPHKAAEWNLVAADLGLAAAQTELGLRYREGEGVQQDLIASAAWFGKAASNGHAGAQFLLGQYYEQGITVDRNPSEARKLYQLAADQKHEAAIQRLQVLPASP